MQPLTEKGYAAAKLLTAINSFGEAWFFDEGNEPIRIYDRKTNQRVRPVLVDANTGKPIDSRQLYAGPGPRARATSAIERQAMQRLRRLPRH